MNTPEQSENSPEQAEEAVQDTNPPEATEQPEKETSQPHREAAKYRTRLREAEAENAALREQLANMQRAAVESIAGQVLKDPAALWTAGAELEAFVQNGTVDAAAVKRFADGLAQKFTPQPQRGYVPTQGTGGAVDLGGAPFETAFQPR